MEKILFFDGVCAMCNGLVAFVLRHDHSRRYKFATLQGHIAATKIPRFFSDNLTSVVLVDGDQIYTESDAIINLLIGLGGVFKIAFLLKIFPKFFRDFIYRWVAKNRYRWFGQVEHCALLTKEQKALILD